jgi:hypothetical protein
MSRASKKPTSFYHLRLNQKIQDGWKVKKHSEFLGSPGTFIEKDADIVFVGWSGVEVWVNR